MAGTAVTGYGSGGMVTKIMAAKIAMGAGCRMAIAPGQPLHALKVLDQGGRCTWFMPTAEPRAAYKQWIAGAVQPTGSLVVDDGAARALHDGKSLLPAGVVSVEGLFERGDTVAVKAKDGKLLAKGLSAYSSADAEAIKGRKSEEIEAVLGYRGRSEIIHRDDLVVEG
jgi:glutamate 5-kinase